MLYIVNDNLYDLYNLVNDIIVVVTASMINNDICKIIRKDVEKAFSEIFSDTFSDLFEFFFLFFVSSFQIHFLYSSIVFLIRCRNFQQ